MSILKNIASAFLEVDTTPEAPKQKDVVLIEPTIKLNPTTNYVAPKLPTVSDEEVKKVGKHFEEFYNSLNDPKPSYHEYKSMVTAMVENGVDLNTAFRGSFAGLKAQGLDYKVLLSTAESTLNSIKQNIEDFNRSANEKYSKIILDKETQNNTLKTELQAITERIMTINKAIEENNTVIAETSAKKEEKVRLFNQVGNQHVATIANDIEVIKTLS